MRTHLNIKPYQLLHIVIGFALMLAFSQCSYEPEFSKQAVSLSFSTDTIQFDTLFTGRQSITKRLKIYNNSKEAVLLDEMNIANDLSPFQLIVNGVKGTGFEETIILAEDSLLVLIEATIDQSNNNNPFVLRASLNVTNKGSEQSVIVEAWGQNAHYLQDSIIACNAVWTSEKPYVLSNNVLVDKGCQLTIEAGAKIYSGKDSFILIAGQLQVNGLKDSLVTFTNDRLDEPFASAPGQWGGIIILEGSSQNEVNYADIKNSIVGINVASYAADGQMDLSLKNCRIGNLTNTAILALNSDFEAENSVFYNTASFTCRHIGGGTANYLHCTIANYFTSGREVPALYLSDSAVDNNDDEIVAPLNVNIINSIIYGRFQEEYLSYQSTEGNLSLFFSHSLFKSQQSSLDVNDNLLNLDPLFNNPFDHDFSLMEGSPAISKALSTSLTIDLLGHDRDDMPDLGAIEYLKEAPGN